MRRSFAVLTHNIHITLNISNQKKVIKRLKMNNMKLHKDSKMLRLVWLKKIVESEKIHLLLIVKIMIKAMMNWLLNINMLNLYQKCFCELFKKSCCIMQCYKCFKLNHMIKFCKNEMRCFKCTNKHHIEKCATLMNKKMMHELQW